MLLCFSGPSTIGKDSTWVRAAEDLGFHREVPLTTRIARAGEQEGVDYQFVTVRDFQNLIRTDKMTEWDYTLGAYYGTHRALRDRVLSGEHVVLQVLARMAIRLRRALPNVYIVMLETSDRATLTERLQKRGYTGFILAERLKHYEEEITHAPLFDTIVPDADVLPHDAVERTMHDILGAERGPNKDFLGHGLTEVS